MWCTNKGRSKSSPGHAPSEGPSAALVETNLVSAERQWRDQALTLNRELQRANQRIRYLESKGGSSDTSDLPIRVEYRGDAGGMHELTLLGRRLRRGEGCTWEMVFEVAAPSAVHIGAAAGERTLQQELAQRSEELTEFRQALSPPMSEVRTALSVEPASALKVGQEGGSPPRSVPLDAAQEGSSSAADYEPQETLCVALWRASFALKAPRFEHVRPGALLLGRSDWLTACFR